MGKSGNVFSLHPNPDNPEPFSPAYEDAPCSPVCEGTVWSAPLRHRWSSFSPVFLAAAGAWQSTCWSLAGNRKRNR